MTPLTPPSPARGERTEQLLEQCAQWVVRKGLEAPALMFLEMHKPLITLAAVSYAMTQPMLMLFFGFRRTEDLRVLLSERDNVEALMQRIELRSKERQQSANRSGARQPCPHPFAQGDGRNKEAGGP